MTNQDKRVGLVHIYTGDGKGKTTSSLGLALRANGHGFKVYIIQFMKGGRYYGEIESIEEHLPNVEIAQFGQGCPYVEEIKEGTMVCSPSCRKCFLPFEGEKILTKKAFKFAKKIILSNEYDLVILDEINNSISKKLLPLKSILELIISKPEKLELVLTGRDVPSELIAVADYVTEMKMIKHPFTKKINARRGIEY